jgi:hypothetical protein
VGGIDLAGLGAVGLVAAEWLALGWFSRVDWPPQAGAFWAPRWALRLLVGAFLVAFAQLIAAFAVGFAAIPLVLGGAGVGAALLRGYIGRAASEEKRLPIEGPERAGWLLLAGILGAACVRSLLVPEAGWDAYSHWGLRAQAYALTGTVTSAHSEHEYYPPLVPLLEAWLYLHRGAISIDLGKMAWALVGSAFGVCLSWHLRLSLRIPWLAPYLGSAIVLSTIMLLDGFWTGQADLALTAFLTLATLAVMRWHQSPERVWLAQAAILGAAAALTKFEGFPRVGVVVLVLVIEAWLARRRDPLIPAAVVAAAAGAAWLLWTGFQLTHDIPANAEHLGQFQPAALLGVLSSLVAVFAGIRTGGAFLIVVLSYVIVWRHLAAEPLRLIGLVVLGQFVATLVAFLVSNAPPETEVRTSATRLFEQFLPLALFVSAVGLSAELPTYNRRGR